MKPTDVINKINAHFGREMVTLANDPKFITRKITSGSYAIDYVLGGGFARGRSVEMFGDWQAGKSYVALRTVAEAQARGEACVYIDAERCLDVAWAQSLGVDLNTLVISSDWEYGEQVVDVVEACLKLGTFTVIVIDSVTALVPKQEIEKSATELTVGQMGKLMSLAMRKLTAANRDTVLLFLNQTREKIGIMFGDATTTPGGKALGFYASQRLRLKLGKKIKDGTNIIGQEVKVLVEKDKTQRPFNQVTFTFDFATNRVNKADELFAIALIEGIVEKAGNMYHYNGKSYRRKALLQHFAMRPVEEDLVERLGLCYVG